MAAADPPSGSSCSVTVEPIAPIFSLIASASACNSGEMLPTATRLLPRIGEMSATNCLTNASSSASKFRLSAPPAPSRDADRRENRPDTRRPHPQPAIRDASRDSHDALSIA